MSEPIAKDDGHRPLFSIVTIAWNDRAGLESTWRSLAGQSETDWVWVVVDAASTDGTVEFLSAISDARVSWVSEPDDGIYPAMNKGAARASGDLLLFLNAGDRLTDEGVLGRVAEDHRKNEWAWAYGGLRYVDTAGHVVGRREAHPFSALALTLGLRFLPHPATYFQREFFEQFAPYDPVFGMAADQELMMRAARSEEPAVVRGYLADFALGGISTSAPPDAFVRASRKIRLAHRAALGGSEIVDATVTRALSLAVRGRAAVLAHVKRGAR